MISLFRENGAKCHLEWYKKATTEAFAYNDLVGINTSGYVTKYLDGSAFPILGSIKRTITSASSDYATATKVPVEVCGEEAEYICDVSTGSAEQTNVGEYHDVDDSNSVDVSATSNNDIYVTGIISATKVLAKLTQKMGNVIES